MEDIVGSATAKVVGIMLGCIVVICEKIASEKVAFDPPTPRVQKCQACGKMILL